MKLSELEIRNAQESLCVPKSHTLFCFGFNQFFFNGCYSGFRGQEASTFQTKCCNIKRIAEKFTFDCLEYSLLTVHATDEIYLREYSI